MAPATLPARPAPPGAAPGSLEGALALGLRLVDAFETLAAGLALDALEPIELPPILGDERLRARLHAVAPLYLAAELESARLVPAAEALAGVYVGGGLRADPGAGGETLLAFWRGRHDRFSREERAAFFRRLFGHETGPSLAVDDATNTLFEPFLIDLTEAIYRLGERSLEAPIGSDLPLRAAATQLAANLGSRGGVPEQASRELLGTIREALAIFGHAGVQAALGAESAWAAVREVARRHLREAVQIGPHVDRAKSGLVVLAWLAGVAPALDAPGRPLEPGAEVAAAATTWLQATLALHEAESSG
jgi:hypothetical protein